MNAKITDRQASVLAYIKNCIAAGAPPTRNEVAQHFGFTYTAAEDHIKRLAQKGRITLLPGKSRNIIVIDENEQRFDDAELWRRFGVVVFLAQCNQ